jgi:hypothetical protein
MRDGRANPFIPRGRTAGVTGRGAGASLCAIVVVREFVACDVLSQLQRVYPHDTLVASIVGS